MVNKSKTQDYDPRYDRAQSISGAKARYVELDGYDIADLEADIERIQEQGENPDKGPIFEGQKVYF